VPPESPHHHPPGSAPSPLPLSIAIICRDNESTIGHTLDSVAGLAAEIVAVDSGSTDGTIELLAKHHARIIRTDWRGHIATKQIALDACRQPWILSLDSDESLTPPLRASIQRELSAPAGPRVDAFRINRKVYYRGQPLNHAWQPEYRLRLVRQARARWTGLDPHDRLELLPTCGGSTIIPPLLEGDLRHDSIGTFPEFLAKQALHARTMAASMAAEGRRGSYGRLITSPPGAFLKQLLFKRAWRDGWPGWLAAGSTAAASLMKHIALIERTRQAAEAGEAGSESLPAQGGYDSSRPPVRP
jgi:glycosyltransferase involved in cell wall biosynthesis